METALGSRPGLAVCLCCERVFKSWDVRYNRICGKCLKKNASLRMPSEQMVRYTEKLGRVAMSTCKDMEI